MTKRLRFRSASFAVGAAAVLALAACGSDNNSDNASGGTSAGTAGGSTDTVSVADVNGVGNVLVNSSGMALYAADQEANGKVVCTDGCTSFWMPLEPGSGTPTAGPGVPKLGEAQRPDGTEQVTADGALLYTFSQDSPGQVKGDGFEDDFNCQHLTWHVVKVDASGGSMTPGTTPGTTPASSGGGSTGGGGYGGGYGGYGG
jgi:predicted lipoprotein with Yx(FWY)xxD motif